MDNNIIEQLDAAWDPDTGFMGIMRDKGFDEDAYKVLIGLLRSISFDNSEEYFPRRMVELLWWMPRVLEGLWDRIDPVYKLPEQAQKLGEIVSEVERILGAP